MATDRLPTSLQARASRAAAAAALRMEQTAQQIVLHVGCGPADRNNLHERFRGADWHEFRVDLDPGVKPDLVASITNLRQIADGSADAVWSSHNLEHLSAHEVPLALAEFYRVLNPGGCALITLPDLQQVAEFIVADKLEDVAYESPAGPITPLDCVFGLGTAIATGRPLMAHRTGFTETTLRKHLERAGFREVRISFSPFALWAEAAKPGIGKSG
jgi:ubiquinone/menaquinone biosynthesis C-methylase UbiE